MVARAVVPKGAGMSDWSKHGGPAFPTNPKDNYPGMSLRDYFAGQAIAGTLGTQDGWAMAPQGQAKWAYEIADAMLKERDWLK